MARVSIQRGAIALVLALAAIVAVLQFPGSDSELTRESVAHDKSKAVPVVESTHPVVGKSHALSKFKKVMGKAKKELGSLRGQGVPSKKQLPARGDWPPKDIVDDPKMALHRKPGANMLTDGYDRTVLLHGVNLVYKRPPYLPDFHDSPVNYEYDDFHKNKEGVPVLEVRDPFKFDDKDANRIKNWGFNWVRLGIFWPAIEPREGYIDTKHYLPKVAKIVKLLAARGIYTLLELHQDIGSRLFCGEGIPAYYIEKLLADNTTILGKAPAFPYPANYAYGLNITIADVKDKEGYCMELLADMNMKGDFGVYSNTAAVGALWKTLYTPGSVLFDGYIRVWEGVSTFFAKPENFSPFISGFELLNEPTASCVDGCDLTEYNTISGTVGNQKIMDSLMNLYVHAAKKIRKQLPKIVLYFEIGMDMYTYTNDVKRWFKFKRKPVPEDDPNAVVGYHSYFCVAWHYKGKTCVDVQNTAIDFQMKYANALNAGSALTEFGSVGKHQPRAEHEIGELIASADARLQSWAYWSYESIHPQPTSNLDEGMYNGTDGQVDLTKFYILTQPYARAVQGKHISTTWKPNENMKLELRLHLDPAISAPTEIFLGAWNPVGFRVITVPDNAVKFQREGSLLFMFTALDTAMDVRVDIHISLASKAYVGPPKGMNAYLAKVALDAPAKVSPDSSIPKDLSATIQPLTPATTVPASFTPPPSGTPDPMITPPEFADTEFSETEMNHAMSPDHKSALDADMNSDDNTRTGTQAMPPSTEMDMDESMNSEESTMDTN